MKKHYLNNKNQIVHITVSALFCNEHDQIMIIQKADKKYNKKWSVIAGHVEENESVEDALLREVKEETGLLLDNDSYVKEKEFKELNDTCRYNADFHDWHVFRVKTNKTLKDFDFDEEEILQAKFINKNDLQLMKNELTSGALSLFLKMKLVK